MRSTPLALVFALLLAPALLGAAQASPDALVGIEMAIDEKWAKPQTVVMFPATFTNLASAPTRLVFAVAKVSGDLKAVVPVPIAVEPGEGTDILFTIQTPYRNGHLDVDGDVTYTVTPQDPATRAPKGDAQEFAVKVHTKGFYVPGPQLFAAMLAIGVAALLLRRAR